MPKPSSRPVSRADCPYNKVVLTSEHTWAGSVAEVVGFDSIGMQVRLIRRDRYNGVMAYVTNRPEFEPHKN